MCSMQIKRHKLEKTSAIVVVPCAMIMISIFKFAPAWIVRYRCLLADWCCHSEWGAHNVFHARMCAVASRRFPFITMSPSGFSPEIEIAHTALTEYCIHLFHKTVERYSARNILNYAQVQVKICIYVATYWTNAISFRFSRRPPPPCNYS